MIRSRAASPSPTLCRAKISVQPQTPMSTATEAFIDAVDAALPSSPPPSPLNPLSSPPRFFVFCPSPQLPLPSPPLPLPTPSSPLLLPSIDRRDDISEAYFLPQKKLCLTAPTPRFEMRESSTAAAARQAERLMSREVGYEITDTWDELVDAIQEIAPTTLEGIPASPYPLHHHQYHLPDHYHLFYYAIDSREDVLDGGCATSEEVKFDCYLS
ncbi:hypothetical protein Tco_1037105 [Tanacetum coccineum]